MGVKKVAVWLSRHWWAGVALLIVGVGLVVLAFVTSDSDTAQQDAVASDGSKITGWAVLLIASGVVIAVGGLYALAEYTDRRKLSPGRRRAQLERLTKSLHEALRTIELIKDEVAAGEELLAKLEEQAEVRGELAKMRSEEAQAVLAELRGTVRLESNRNTWVSLVMSAAFLALGLVLGRVFR